MDIIDFESEKSEDNNNNNNNSSNPFEDVNHNYN